MKLPEIFRKPKDTGGNGNEPVIKALPVPEKIHYIFEKTDGEWQFNKLFMNADETTLKTLNQIKINFDNDNMTIGAFDDLEWPCKIHKTRIKDADKFEAVIYLKDEEMGRLGAFMQAIHGEESLAA